jgi:DamX protein
MTHETQHALEQAERIVQYAKYSDRFMVAESASLAERRAFVKLVRDKLPAQVDSVTIHAESRAGAHAPIHALGAALQLSAGIREVDELHRAATATLDTHDRLLVIIENADAWLASEAAHTLFELIESVHEHARERLLFLLVGKPGLCSELETAQPLATVIADLHCVRLLGTAPGRESEPAPAAAPSEPASDDRSSIDEMVDFSSTERPGASVPRHRPRRHHRPVWTQPPFLIAAVISVAVITIGIFALLSRSGEPETAAETTVALDTSTRDEAAADTTKAEPTPDEPAASEPEPEAPPTVETATMQLADHGKPPHVPFPTPETTRTAPTPAPTETTPASDEPAAAPATEPSSAAASDSDSGDTGENTEPVAQADDGLDHAWFRDRPRARAVIQLAAFASIDGAQRMIETHAAAELPAEDWHLYAQRVNGRVLYTVTWGDFPSTQRARHAIEGLPEALRSLEPYPRSVGDVQDRLVDD